MKEKVKTVPELRFKGFTDDWEQCELGDVVDNVGTGRSSFKINDSKSDENPYEILGSTSVIGYDDSYDHEGSFILTARVGANAGTLYTHSGQVKITDNTVFIQSKQLSFLYNLLIKEDLKKLAFGTGQPLVKASELKNLKLKFPTTDEEQEEIGTFFRTLDITITLHQRKLELLKTLKQAYLQNLFPENGDKVPRVRFSNFTEDWEQYTVSDFALETYGGGTPRTTIEEYWNGDIDWLQSSDIAEHEVFSAVAKKHITLEGVQKSATKLIPANSIAIVTRVGVGKLAFMPKEYATSQDFLSLSKLKVDAQFGVYSLYKKLQNELHAVQGTSIKGITKEELLSKRIFVPKNIEEQTAIGNFFSILDHTITFHQRKLESLQSLKKSLLQKMFI